MRFDSSHLNTRARQELGLVLVLSGIEGYGPFAHSLAMGIGDGSDCGIEVYEWTTRRPFSTLSHLWSLERNLEQAERLADRIEQHWQQYPKAPVQLIGHSGGAGIGVFALEELARRGAPPIDNAVLLAPAISPHYDLCDSLQQTQRMISFHSRWDVPHLVLGTVLLGTIDRRHEISAGFCGFAERDDDAYQRLEQRPYQARMREVGMREAIWVGRIECSLRNMSHRCCWRRVVRSPRNRLASVYPNH